MAFIKTGENVPVQGYYINDDMELELCGSCQHPMIVIAVSNEDNKLVCKKCDLGEKDITDVTSIS